VALHVVTYHVLVGQGGAVSTDLMALAHVIATYPPGRYEVFETMSVAPSTTRLWGVAIKHDDGRVELRESPLSVLNGLFVR
jgi:hypothetical protein